MQRFAQALIVIALSLTLTGCDPREWFVCAIGACGPQYDEVAPERPAGLAVAAGDGRVTLRWTQNKPPDLSHYKVYRATAADGPYAQWSTSALERYLDTGLSNGTTYWYEVTAVDGAGNESRRSERAGARPDVAAPPPQLPAPVLTATGEVGQIKLEWTEVAGAVRYELYRATASGGPPALIADTIVKFLFDRDVTPGTPYQYTVAGVDATGQVGHLSAPVSTASLHNTGPPLGLLLTFGSRGTGNGSFIDPVGIAADGVGAVYVTDNPDNGRLQKFTPAGEYAWRWDFGGSVGGVTVGPNGTVYVVGRFLSRVEMFNAAGTFLGQFSPGLLDPTAIATGPDGSVYVVDSGHSRVVKTSAAGTFVREWAVNPTAAAIAVDRDGNVYVADRGRHRVFKYTADGTPVLDWGARGTGDGQFEAPAGIVVDLADRVFVADTGNDRIQVFTRGGVITQNFGAGLEGPTALATDCAANLYILDAGNARVRKLGPGTDCSAPTARATAARSRFSATMTTTATTPGRLTGTSERGARAGGTFTGKLTGRRSERGTWRARFDIAIDARTGTGVAKGVVLAKRKRSPALCLRFDLKLAGGKLTGSFTALSGIGGSGSFTQSLGAGGSFALAGTAKPARRGRSSACRGV